MEVCRKCKKPLEENEKYIDVLASWTLGFLGRGKYHLDCWDKSKKIGIAIVICVAVVSLAIIITVATLL